MKKYYVNASSTAGTPDGSSWAKAFQNLQAAVDAADATGGGEVWVARGTYRATTDQVVSMKEGVLLYGGFVGTETALNQRDWKNHVTIIDGEGQRRGVGGANNAVLDGFVITRGHANDGGGMYNNGTSPTIANCTFERNTAKYYGGGMYNYQASPSLTSCTFARNAAYYGGAMRNYDSSPTVTSCTFNGNTAKSSGGGMYNINSSPTVTNCILLPTMVKTLESPIKTRALQIKKPEEYK